MAATTGEAMLVCRFAGPFLQLFGSREPHVWSPPIPDHASELGAEVVEPKIRLPPCCGNAAKRSAFTPGIPTLTATEQPSFRRRASRISGANERAYPRAGRRRLRRDLDELEIWPDAASAENAMRNGFSQRPRSYTKRAQSGA
jgi:hypothetical protein